MRRRTGRNFADTAEAYQAMIAEIGERPDGCGDLACWNPDCGPCRARTAWAARWRAWCVDHDVDALAMFRYEHPIPLPRIIEARDS